MSTLSKSCLESKSASSIICPSREANCPVKFPISGLNMTYDLAHIKKMDLKLSPPLVMELASSIRQSYGELGRAVTDEEYNFFLKTLGVDITKQTTG